MDKINIVYADEFRFSWCEHIHMRNFQRIVIVIRYIFMNFRGKWINHTQLIVYMLCSYAMTHGTLLHPHSIIYATTIIIVDKCCDACLFIHFVVVQEVQAEGRYAIDSPGSPNAPEIPPEDYALRE